MLLVVAQNATRGIATISIDQPNHGSRSAAEGGYVFELVHPDDVDTLSGVIGQSPLDHVALLRAVQTSLADVDASPWNPFDPWRANGLPDLDPDRIFYEGTSMGGFLGLAFAGLAPELDGVGIHVGGVGIMSDLSESLFWDVGFNSRGIGFRGVIPEDASAGEAAAMTASVQHALDTGDAVNLVDRLRSTPTLLVYAIDDGAVINAASEAFAALAGLPLYGRILDPVPFLGVAPALPADGSGAWQIDTSSIPYLPGELGTIDGLLRHVAFLQEQAVWQFNAWLEQRLAAG